MARLGQWIDGLVPAAAKLSMTVALAGLLAAATGTGGVQARTFSLGLLDASTIFDEARPDISYLDPARVHTLLVTGDVGLVRKVNQTTVDRDDFSWPFRQLKDVLAAADLTLINLEGPLVPDCPLRSTGFTFCGDERNVQGLQFAGVDVAALANNHMYNHGESGLRSTREVLDRAGIEHFGYGQSAAVQRDEVRFGFLSYEAVTRWVDREAMRAEIDALRQSSDVVVVMFHWGTEYVRVPEPWPGHPASPRDLARAAIDAGADLVVGNHPHWFQGVEMYRGHLIAYSHGNTVFDQPWSVETQQGMLGRYTFYDNRLIDAEFIPIRLEGWGQPRIADADEGAYLLRVMKSASEALRPY